MTSDTQNAKKGTSIPSWLLITVVITLVAGLVAGYVLNNLLTEKQVTLSTASIISFVFTVALGAASIILAIITMILSRQAEDALIRRSDEGIRLQTDVFVRTNEVLSKIQSSTGVTEKRIEDIISGRTAIIAQEVVEKSISKGGERFTDETVEQIKKDLANSLKDELLPLLRIPASGAEEALAVLDTKQQRQKEISRVWRLFRSQLVAEIRKHSKMTIVSEGPGNWSAESPDKFWDIVLTIGDERYAVDSHIGDQFYEEAGVYHYLQTDASKRIDAARKLSWRITQDNIHVLVFAWDKDVSEEGAIKEILSLLHKANPTRDIRLVCGTPERIIQSLIA